ncbi:MAG: endolytic transglycosylase MltG [Halofilum sp. (in: g-proteobacteria)]|nr:endolytic transglycosylase MltG [Halofilum sp. (in: g-proteobacteria)]
MKRRARWILGLGGGAVLLAGAVVVVDFLRFLHGPMRPTAPQPLTLLVAPGSPVTRVAHDLAAEGWIERPLYFRIAARASGAARRIQAGEYRIPPGQTPQRLLERMVAGDVKTYTLTVIEGWTFDQMMAAVRNHAVLEQTLPADAAGSAVMEALGQPDEHPEGWFFPDTYQFPRGTSDLDLLRRANERMQRVLEEEWAGREEGLPLDSAYEALILASIIERETGVPEERARIAGVFVERLERGMRLQTDPTVIYGLGDEFDGDLRFRHLRTDTPYNTYTRAGLTPTPIALPSRAAIHAAVHPDRRGEVYFVATGDGRHVFSKTLEEHNEAVIEYQLGGDASRLRGRN